MIELLIMFTVPMIMFLYSVYTGMIIIIAILNQSLYILPYRCPDSVVKH